MGSLCGIAGLKVSVRISMGCGTDLDARLRNVQD